MGKKRFIKPLPNVNASSLSPPRSQFQLNWTNEFGDINCLCNWLSILQSNNNMNDTRGRVFVEACLLRPFLDCFSASTPKMPAQRGPKPKQIGTSDYCRTCGYFVYVNINGTWQLSRSLKLQRIFFFRKQKIIQVGFVRIAVIRLEAPPLDFVLLKPAFKKESTRMISFEQNVRISSWFRGMVMQ